MIVISRGGKTTIIRGWRAWLIGASVFMVTTVLVALLAFLILGAAITVTAVLFIAVPVALGATLIASLFRSRT
jgi:hypothetical protein